MSLKVTWRKYNENSDEDLVRKFRDSGDLDLLGLLFERYMHLVYGVCLKYFEDRDQSKDEVSAIFEKLIIELPRHEVENFKSWLYVLTKNHCLMQLRAGKTARKKQEQWENEQEKFVESGVELHPVDEENNSLDKILLDCIDRLKELQRQCVKMFYFEERSYREIAAELEIEEKKVKSYIQNGKRNLRICIDQKNGKTA